MSPPEMLCFSKTAVVCCVLTLRATVPTQFSRVRQPGNETQQKKNPYLQNCLLHHFFFFLTLYILGQTVEIKA